MTSLRILGCFLALLFFCTPASAQNGDASGVDAPRSQERIKQHGVGVVMSGGGAKGLYHIGVLEALEANDIPIDYIAGTSMGSIIAAMYAAGYTPAEMREIVESGAIKDWVSGRIDPNRYLPYYRQYGQPTAMFNVRLDFRKGNRTFQTPTNLLSSTQIDMALTKLFAPATAASEGDFNRLMVPFFCVASDMKSRKPVVLRQGSLCEAVRSSMSIPLVFKAVARDSMLLYDGGIFDNFPWKPLDEIFQPETIIGSICTSGNTIPNEKNGIIEQAVMLAMQNTDYALPEGRSICIARAVDVNFLDFDRATEIMDAGYKDAMGMMPQILEQVSGRRSAEELQKRRETFRESCPPLIFNNYQISGSTPAQIAYIRDFIRADRRYNGKQRLMDFDQLRDNLYVVLSGGEFTMDLPRVHYDSVSQRYTFEGIFRTKPNFKISIGGSVSSTAFNMGYFGVNYQSIGRVGQSLGVNLYLGPLHTWGNVGGRTDFYIWKPFFIDYSFNYNIRNLTHGNFGNITKVDNTAEIKESEVFGTFTLGMPLTHRSLVVLQTHGGQSNYHYTPITPAITESADRDHTRFVYFGAQAAIHRNTLDKALLPRYGSELQLSGIYITGSERYAPYDQEKFVSKTSHSWLGARLTWNKYIGMPQYTWFSLGLNFDAVYTTHPHFSNERASILTLPAYAPLPHSKIIYMPEFRGKQFIAGGIMPTFDMWQNSFFRLGFYAMYRNHRGNYGMQEHGGDQLHYILDASFVYHTPIGPASLSLTKYDLHNSRNMYLIFNFGFQLFAPKGLFY